MVYQGGGKGQKTNFSAGFSTELPARASSIEVRPAWYFA